jgi:hypothetical protein
MSIQPSPAIVHPTVDQLISMFGIKMAIKLVIKRSQYEQEHAKKVMV